MTIKMNLGPTAVLRPGALTGPAMQALGLVRFADDPGAQGAAGGDGGTGTPPPAGEPAGGNGDDGKGGTGDPRPDDWKVDELPKGAQDYIRQLRAENKKDRTSQQESAAEKARAEQIAQIAQLLGIQGAENPTPEQLAQQANQYREQAETYQAKLAEYERRDRINAAAGEVKVNAAAALALKDTDAAFADVDINDPKAVQDALLQIADKHPHIKVASTVDRTGGDFQNGTGRDPSDPKDLSAAIGVHYQ